MPQSVLVKSDLISGLIIIFAVAMNVKHVNGNLDHCTTHAFANSHNTSFMQFTKETVSQEYAIEGQFKSLHCCAKRYTSIEW